MRKKLVSMLLIASMVALIGCGGSDKKTDGGKPNSQSVDATETSSEVSETDKSQDLEEDKSEGESFIAKLNPTYEINKTDVSEYYFVNPNISIGKPFLEITNVSSVTLKEWNGYDEKNAYKSSDKEYASLEDISDKYLLEGDYEQIDIKFSEGGNIDNKEMLGVYGITASFNYGESVKAYEYRNDASIMKLKDILAGGGTVSYGKDVSEINSDAMASTIQLKDVFNIDFEGNAEESLIHLKELWGEPSAIRCHKNIGMADVYWVFDSDTAVTIEVHGIMSDKPTIRVVYLTWYDSEKRMENINTQYVDLENDNYYWYKRADVPMQETKEESYSANLPEDIVLTFDDKSMVITKDNWKNVFAELGIPPNNEEGNGYYLESEYPGIRSQGIECTADKLIIKMPNFAGMNKTAISVLGLTSESTLLDIKKIFGSEPSYKDDGFGEYFMYRYEELNYEGVSKVEISLYNTGSIIVEIFWE